MKKILTLCFFAVTFVVPAQPKLQTPAEFLGYELGDRFTRHYRMVEYFKHIAEAAPQNVRVQQYGET
ncbi:MAG TPA: hypothetical protein VKQ08_07155, partial [Cyclobacteriaceae bacterium]|nr:hypothetical protein [Cyclobacteriaceae bacterium]